MSSCTDTRVYAHPLLFREQIHSLGIIQTQVHLHFEIEMETHGQLLEIEQTQIQLNPIDLTLIDLESVPYQIVGPSLT